MYDGKSNFFEFRARTDIEVTEATTTDHCPDGLVNAPFTKFYAAYPYEAGSHDTVERISEWIKKKIPLMDEVFDYQEN